MAGVLREGGLLVVTSRNWERVRDQGSGLQVAEKLSERDGQQGLVVNEWIVSDSWDEAHYLDVAAALIDPVGA